ncbi:MAG: hypothetical protein AAGJ79_04800 [Verrucomicrobiota bacterium]
MNWAHTARIWAGSLGMAAFCWSGSAWAQGESANTDSAAGIAIGARSKGLDGESEIREKLEGFFAALEDGKVRTAFEQLLKDSAIGEQGSLESLIERTNEVLARFGEVSGNELMKTKRRGQRLVAYTYLSHGEIFPLQWEIFCYRGSKGWQILDITVNNDLVRIFTD